MAQTAGDILVETLIDWGVEAVFGLPGDGINGIMEALRKRQDKIRFIQVRHEEAAAFMACAYAKFTGKLGVCLATSGPAGIHLLNGLYDAKLDGQPVLAITGLQLPRPDRARSPSRTSTLDKLFMDVCRLQRAGHGPGACRERRRARLPHRARPPRRRAHHLPHRHAGAMPGARRALASATCRATSPTCMRRRAAMPVPPSSTSAARRF